MCSNVRFVLQSIEKKLTTTCFYMLFAIIALLAIPNAVFAQLELNSSPFAPNRSVAIVNGDSEPSILDGTDFGSTFVGKAERNFFEMVNTGSEFLSLPEPKVIIAGPHSSDFIFIPFLGSGLSSGQRQLFQIAFQPRGLGVRNATVLIESDDLGSPYTFAVTGNAVFIAPTLVSGNEQAAAIGERFEDELVVRVLDQQQMPVRDVRVLFSAPTTGASGVVSRRFFSTGADGYAKTRVRANSIAGTYNVIV